ncbi:hypothetical protein ACIGKR_11970 [Rhodococcus qingshengii]|uniref:hypothetical protein n=1 Tax=Rhodococcus qingshengii TaxID=334542 RepID=UPI0037CBD0D9
MDSLTWSHLVGFAGSAVGLIGGGYGVRMNYLSTRDTNDTNETTTAADNQRKAFEAFAEQQRKDFEVLLTPMRDDITRLTEKVARLEEVVTVKEAIIRAKDVVIASAVTLIHLLIGQRREDAPAIDIPEPLVGYVDTQRI